MPCHRPHLLRIQRLSLPRIIALATAGLVLGVVTAGLPSDASAAYKRIAATVCQPEYTTNTHRYVVDDGDWGIQNMMNAYEYASFVCPVPDNTDLPNTSGGKLTEIAIQGYDANDNTGSWTDMIARVCSWDADSGNGLDCSDWVSSHDGHPSTFAGNFEMSLNLTEGGTSVLGTPGDTLYLWVDMPVADGTNYSLIRTLYFEN